MKIVIDNALNVYNPNEDIRKFCRDNLVIDNPDYISKTRMGRWAGNTPRYLHLYEEIENRLVIPYGCKGKILSLAKNEVTMWAEYPEKCDLRADYKSKVNLYSYQSRAIQAMLGRKYGIVVMPCGSGKTQTALECIARVGLKALWLTHTQDLLTQSMERAKLCFECDENMFGTITAGKVHISKGITFATVQTMCKIDLQKYKTEWPVIIVDECQHCCGTPTRLTQFYKVINSLYAPYKFGLTATPDRPDGLDRSMYALLGGKIAEVDKSEVAEYTCPVVVKCIDTGFMPDCDKILNGDGTINYTSLTSDLTTNKERFAIVASVINDVCRGKSMVLANRVQYLKDMQQAYKGRSICLSTIGTSKKAREERKNALRMLGTGEIDCIFATYQLAAEGLDCPSLRYIVFATPEKNSRTVTQALGRVARKAEGKEFGTVIDFVDEFGMYKGWAKKRKGYYKKLDCNFVQDAI